MVNARDDPIHPMSSAEAMKEIFGHSATLVVVDKAGVSLEHPSLRLIFTRIKSNSVF